MRLLHKVLAVSGVTLAGLYGFALSTIPPTVYVFIALEDSEGKQLELPQYWSSHNHMREGVIDPGGSIYGTDDLADDGRCYRIRCWESRFIDGSEYAVFACRPGAEAAFAGMTDKHGAAEVVRQLPEVSTLIPWSMAVVRLRLPHRPEHPLGELVVTVLDEEGCIPDTHPGLSLISPVAGLPLLFNFGEAFGVEDRWELGPVRASLPAGEYRVKVDQWFGITCGNMAPSVDRHQRRDVLVEVESGGVSQVVLERPRGTLLDLDLTFTGDGGEFAALRDEFLEEWEAVFFDDHSVPPHPWRAEAWLQRLDDEGLPVGRRQRYMCGWDGCKYSSDRFRFPVSGLVGGLRQYEPGLYRLSIQGEGIEPLTRVLHLPDLDGGSVVFCAQLATTGLSGTETAR